MKVVNYSINTFYVLKNNMFEIYKMISEKVGI